MEKKGNFNQFFKNIDEEIKREMTDFRKAGLERHEAKQALLNIPDPAVFKNGCPVKAILV